MILTWLHVTLWIASHYVLPIVFVGIPLCLIGAPVALWLLAKYGTRSGREGAAEQLELLLLSLETPAEKRYRESLETKTSEKYRDSALLDAMRSIRRVNRWYSRHTRRLPAFLNELTALWIIAHYHNLRVDERWMRIDPAQLVPAKVIEIRTRARA